MNVLSVEQFKFHKRYSYKLTMEDNSVRLWLNVIILFFEGSGFDNNQTSWTLDNYKTIDSCLIIFHINDELEQKLKEFKESLPPHDLVLVKEIFVFSHG
jgi:hypothetical protein